MQRYVWLSDTHLNLSVLPFLKRLFVSRLKSARPDGIFITGDISIGLGVEFDLRFLARNFDCPIYFVLGNHDYHLRYISSVHSDMSRLTREVDHLHWMTEESTLSLSPGVALIGTEGWYDARMGDPKYLRWTSDWMLTFDFLQQHNMEERLETWRAMAQKSADEITVKLENALQRHSTVYLMTHFPPWREATRGEGTLLERYWMPYNTNDAMGQAIEKVMANHPTSRVIVLAGHTHNPCYIHVSDTIECRVARASYWGPVSDEGTIVI